MVIAEGCVRACVCSCSLALCAVCIECVAGVCYCSTQEYWLLFAAGLNITQTQFGYSIPVVTILICLGSIRRFFVGAFSISCTASGVCSTG